MTQHDAPPVGVLAAADRLVDDMLEFLRGGPLPEPAADGPAPAASGRTPAGDATAGRVIGP